MITRKQIIVVNTEAMLNDALFRAMNNANMRGKVKVSAWMESASNVALERSAFEAVQERMIDGRLTVGQSPDIKHVHNLAASRAFALIGVALKLDPRAILFPQSRDGGKSSVESSSLKSYKKYLEIAETIWTGVSTLENVVKVNTVCAWKMTQAGKETLERKEIEDFFRSREYLSISQGSEDFLKAVEEVDALRAAHMSGGAATQTSQMVRTLVALKSAVDVRSGRSKNTAFNPDGKVIQALMRRFGQVTSDGSPEGDLADSDAHNPELEQVA